jgi:hypothetical protein
MLWDSKRNSLLWWGMGAVRNGTRGRQGKDEREPCMDAMKKTELYLVCANTYRFRV